MTVRSACLPLISSVLIGFAATPVFARADPWDALRSQARRCAEVKDWAGAEKLYTQAIALIPLKDGSNWPERSMFYEERGDVREKLNDLDGAIADYTTAQAAVGIGSNSFVHSLLTKSGQVWLKKGEPLRALVSGLIGVDYSNNAYSAHALLADAWYVMGNLEEAKRHFAEAKRIYDERSIKGVAEDESWLARTYTEEGAQANAAAYLSKHRAIDDSTTTNQAFAAALAAQKAGKADEALNLYRETLEKSPTSSSFWGNMGVIHFAAGRNGDAINDMSMAIILLMIHREHKLFKSAFDEEERTANEIINLKNRALAYARLRRFEEAITDLQLVLYLKADDPDASKKLADYSERLSKRGSLLTEVKPSAPTSADLKKARALYATAAAAIPKNTVERESRQQTILQAQALLDGILSADPKNGEVLILRGQVEFVKNSLSPAIKEYFDRAISVDPKNAEAWYQRGHLDRYARDKASLLKAIEALSQAIALGKNDAETQLELIGTLEQAKDYAGAIKQVTLLIDANPQKAEYRRKRASFYEALKRWPDAITDWTAAITLKNFVSDIARRADVYIENKQLPAALADFDKAIEREPKNGEHFVGRARAKRLSGDTAGALADYAKGHTLDPTLPAVKPDLSDADKADTARKSYRGKGGGIFYV